MNSLNKHLNKIQTIQEYLKSGMTREEAAKLLGYSTWRSLDIFMRREGMRWSSNLKRYIGEDEISYSNESGIKDISPKTAKIISLFNDENADPKQIAQQTGFKDHLEMAEYMSARGYTWSNEVLNYIKPSETSDLKTSDKAAKNYERPVYQSSSKENYAVLEENTDEYTCLLNFLSKHKERLYELLVPESNSKTIPRYVVPGITRTKSFYMSDSLSRLLSEFCNCKNLSQKEVIEAALIEFLSKYSFKKEVDVLIKGSNNMHNLA